MRKIIKILATIFLSFILLFGGCFYFISPRPPKESDLIMNFNEHRSAFEQLRNMLQADTNLSRVANWGVETRKPFFLGYPSEQNFSIKRYTEYLALLNQVKGQLACRSEGVHADPGVMVWGWGWAGDSKHIWVCWMDESPTNQVPTLDGYHGRNVYPNREVAFRRIDGSWYLATDQ